MAEQLKVTRNIDNRLNLNNERSYDFTQGCGFISYVNYDNQSSNIGNTISITCNPPNRNIVVSRRVMKTATFTVTLTGTVSADNLLKDFCHAPSFMPIMQITSNESFRLGSSTITQTNMTEAWRALLRYSSDIKDSESCYTLSAAFPDQAQTFEELIGFNRNPLGVYGDNFMTTPRGGLVSYNVVSNTPTQAVVTFKVSEPLFLSPFVFGSNAGNMPGLVGIETMQYNATFGNKALAFSCVKTQDGTSNITNVSTVVNSFSLGFEYLTPQVNMEIPRSLVCSYFQPYVVSAAKGVALPPGGIMDMPQIRIQLEGIPRRVYLFACDAVSEFSPFEPSTFLPLQDVVGCVSVRMNGIPSLESHDRQAIYEICRTNGMSGDYQQFSKYTGSVVCLDYSRDIGCNPEQAPGLAQMNEFQTTIKVINNSATRIINNPTFYCVVIYDGIFSVIDGVTRYVINPLSASDVMNAPTDKTFKQSNLPADVYGGAFWDRLRGAVRRGADFVKENKLISRGLALAGHDEASKLADSYGLGVSGGGISGGRLISRKQLTMMPRF